MGSVYLKWIESTYMTGVDSYGHSIVVGSSSGRDPEWAGLKPSDLLLLAAASCSSYDVVTILKKQRQPLEALEVICTGEQASEAPYNFTSFHLHYKVKGEVEPKKLLRAIELSEEKYCSVINSLDPEIVITHNYEIEGQRVAVAALS